MTDLLQFLDDLWKYKQPVNITREESWIQYCKKHQLAGKDIEKTMQRVTFDNFDALQREFTSKSILKCIACKSDNVDWRSVQTCRADESETIFAECKSCRKKWRFR